MNRRTLPYILLIITAALALGACAALEQPTPTVDPNQLATVVSETLTAVPTRALPPEATDTPVPTPVPSDTPLPPTEAPPPPTDTEEPSATPPPTPTLEPTGTLQAGDPKTTLGDPTWRDPLASGVNWPLGEDDFTEARMEDGRLAMTGLTSTDGWRLTWPEIQDFYLEMTVETGTCEGSDHYGVMARVPDRTAADRGYLFGVTCDGRYSLRTWDGETMTDLVPRTADSAILAGSETVNRIGLWAVGEQLILYANGVRLTEIQDDTFTDEGSFGIFVGARLTENFTIYLDEIAYWANP